MKVLKEVQKLANEIIAKDPLMKEEQNLRLNNLIKDKFADRIEI